MISQMLCQAILCSSALFNTAVFSTAVFSTAFYSGEENDTSFQELASEYRTTLGAVDESSESLAVDSALQQRFLQVPVGPFEFYYPVPYLDKGSSVKQLQDIALGALDLTGEWNRQILGQRKRSSKTDAPGTAVLAKWIRGWKSRDLQRLVQATDRSGQALVDLEASASIRQASDELRDYFRAGAGLSRPPSGELPIRIVLAPTREEFVHFVSYLGSLHQDARSSFWVKNMPAWNVTRWRSLHVLPLEYPVADAPTDFHHGDPMDRREKSGLLEHVLHHASNQLGMSLVGEEFDFTMRRGLSTNLVIELLGQNNARAGGSNSSSSKNSQSKFVRGGMSQGGKLPPQNADSQWRRDKGRHHFARVLAQGQKQGANIANPDLNEARLVAFAVQSSDGSGSRHCVAAPFLGEHIPDKQIPAAFLSDYMDFLRAYDAAFVHWLRTEARTSNKSKSEAAFAELLHLADDPLAYAIAVEKRYDVPLSASDLSQDCLERRFLIWISRQ